MHTYYIGTGLAILTINSTKKITKPFKVRWKYILFFFMYFERRGEKGGKKEKLGGGAWRNECACLIRFGCNVM